MGRETWRGRKTSSCSSPGKKQSRQINERGYEREKMIKPDLNPEISLLGFCSLLTESFIKDAALTC